MGTDRHLTAMHRRNAKRGRHPIRCGWIHLHRAGPVSHRASSAGCRIRQNAERDTCLTVFLATRRCRRVRTSGRSRVPHGASRGAANRLGQEPVRMCELPHVGTSEQGIADRLVDDP